MFNLRTGYGINIIQSYLIEIESVKLENGRFLGKPCMHRKSSQTKKNNNPTSPSYLGPDVVVDDLVL